MDLGVGREMFDLEYRQQMEKDKEIALHKEKEKVSNNVLLHSAILCIIALYSL